MELNPDNKNMISNKIAMIFFENELNLLCTECSGYMKKIIYCAECTLPFHPHCITTLCKYCLPETKSPVEIKNNFDFHLKKYIKFNKKPFKESVAPFLGKKCHSCNKNAFYFYQKHFCIECFYKISKNEFCPICFMVYEKNDFSVEMICCDFCNRWIHFSCTNLTKKDYDAIENEDYCCNICIDNGFRFSSLGTKEKEVCYICKIGYLHEDPLFVLYPYKGKYKHLNCQELATPCVICNESSPSSVKCGKCVDSFHFQCSSGLFRQDKYVSMCNLHFKPIDFKKEAYKMIKSSFQEENSFLTEERSFYAKGVIYKENEFIKLIFGKKNKKAISIFNIQSEKEISYLSFNGYNFYLNSVRKSFDDLILLGIKMDDDPFRINTNEFMVIRRNINDEFIKKLCILTKNQKYFFGEE